MNDKRIPLVGEVVELGDLKPGGAYPLQPGEKIEFINNWQPIETAPDNKRLLVRGPSGYIAPNDIHYETARTALTDGKRRWINDAGYTYTDRWSDPTEWLEIPE